MALCAASLHDAWEQTRSLLSVVGFLALVLVLARLGTDEGLFAAAGLGHLLRDGKSPPALLGVTAVAAVLANVIDHLPAVLALLPLTAPGGPGPVLPVLIGVNLGPNLTYVGSLATLLWRRILHAHDTRADLGHFTRLGLVTLPATLLASAAALWGMLHTIGT